MADSADRPARRPPARVPAVLAVLALLLGAVVVWLSAQGRQAQAEADEREAVLLAARTHALNLMSLDHRTIEADLRRILTTSTGAARAEYEAGAAKLRKTTLDGKVVQEGVVRAAGLVSLSGANARVLVVADTQIRWDGSAAAPQERFYRWAMDLVRERGLWLVAKAVQVA